MVKSGPNSRQQSQYARSLIEASLDPLFTISPEGKITDINNASLVITEKTREDLIDTDFFEYFTEPDKAREIYKEVFAEGFVADYPLTISGKNPTDVLFNGSVYKDESGKVLGVVIVARDITDLKRFELELLKAKERAELATKIAEEAQCKAEKAARIAEAAVKSKQQFLSNMSHEIRTPMNAIIGFTKVLLKTNFTAKQKEYLHAIKMSGDALTVLINDILDLAKVDAGKMSFEQTPFKIRSSISAMIHLFETKILEKNLLLIKIFDSDIPAVVIGDPVRLHQIFLNLVSNAVKFTNEGEISINIKLLNENEEKVTIEFSVSDTGIGISEDQLVSIFENFQQASSETSRLYGGTGLGLAIAKHLVESQGGIINVKSILGKGSTFTFSLPFLKATEQFEIEKEIKPLDNEMGAIKVLVVEDIALNQLLMRTVLEDFGYEADIAANGIIAIEKLKINSYSIILMDLHMPEMDGFETTKYIRETMKSQIPIIALTADVTTSDLQKCKALGMNDYVSKPLDEELLYRKIIELVNKTAVEQENESGSKRNIIYHQPKGMSEYIDLTYLTKRTKNNVRLMNEMIELYLEQTPVVVARMIKSLDLKDWDSLYSAAHKMIPSFSIVGMHQDFEEMARKIQNYAKAEENPEQLPELVFQLERACFMACQELKEKSNQLKNNL
jgi:PAS domain S-box-containing protein